MQATSSVSKRNLLHSVGYNLMYATHAFITNPVHITEYNNNKDRNSNNNNLYYSFIEKYILLRYNILINFKHVQ